jgi:hypothetical protein
MRHSAQAKLIITTLCIMLSVIMLGVAFCLFLCHYAECRGALPKDAFTRPTKMLRFRCDFSC